MMVIGLTGGIASGKSTVAAMLRKANIPVVDGDELAHRLTLPNSPVMPRIIRLFGETIITEDGSLDRKKVAAIVFADAGKRKELEAILHPEISRLSKAILKRYEDDGHDIAVYMAPLIFEAGIDKELFKTIVVIAPRELMQQRAMTRNGSSAEQIAKRMNAQLDDATKIAKADAVIENRGSLEDLYDNLSRAWKKVTGLELPK